MMKYIISTSDRPTSNKRYQKLLQEILKLNIAYIPISPYSTHGKIEAENFAAAIKGLGAIGGAISKDIKYKIIPHLDELDTFAKQIQSVNTVIREGSKLIGYNTDAHGFEHAIKDGIKNSGIPVKKALIYGYGGVFSVAFHVLSNLGAKVFVTGRRPIEVDKKNKAYNLEPYTNQPIDLFVNATPVSDSPLENTPGFIDCLKKCKIVFDHQMPGTFLTNYCKSNNIYHIPGTQMYYPQMYKQWALFLKGHVLENELPSLIKKAET